MNLENKKILLTGATGGIGMELTHQLSLFNCQLMISGTNQSKLTKLANEISARNASSIKTIAADISSNQQCNDLIAQTHSQLNGLDILINLAGTQTFNPLSKVDDKDIESQISTNLTAPIILSRQASMLMQSQGHGHIVNIGSTFGSIAFANFSVYSAAKFGLRGFSEALRRELKGSGVNVSYIAPRTTKTSMNSDAIYEMAKETGMNMDSPSVVAAEIINAISKNKKNHYIGYPEKIYAHINAIFPGLLDKALHKQNQISLKYT